jgi:peptide/nickel transport system permease protein
VVREALRWLVSSLVLLFVVSALTFVLVSLAPGDAAKSILAGQTSTYTQEQYEQMRELLGIDRPLHEQYWQWLTNLTHGSLGRDLFSGQEVTDVLAGRIGPSLSIILGTVLVSGLLGVGLGLLSAWRGGWLGRAVDAVSLVGFAIPNFWLALVLVELLAVRVALFPAGGYTDLASDPAKWFAGIVLPVLTLSAGAIAFVAKQTRDATADVLSREYVTMLHARGLAPRTILLKHVLRNASIPVVTLLGLLLVSLLSGTVLVESVFSIPGLGQEAVNATGSHNLPLIAGVAFYFTIVVIVANLLVDLSYRFLNPKVRAT